MNNGDMVRLVNRPRLKDVSIATHEGSTAILQRSHFWPKIGEGWYFELEGTKIHLWAPTECLELIDERTQTNEMSEMKEGDKAELINCYALHDVSMDGCLGKIVTLHHRLSPSEKATYGGLRKYHTEDIWWVTIEGGGDSQRYVPARCLHIRQDMKCGCYNGNCKETKPTITKKEQTIMYLHTVTIIKQPSTLAQQAGEIETIIVPSTEVMANDTTSAVAQVAADNAEAITPLKGKSTIKVVVKQVA